jgi:hypothetical protein
VDPTTLVRLTTESGFWEACLVYAAFVHLVGTVCQRVIVKHGPSIKLRIRDNESRRGDHRLEENNVPPSSPSPLRIFPRPKSLSRIWRTEDCGCRNARNSGISSEVMVVVNG